MNRRQIIQIGSALPPGVTATAFALAQVPSIVAWPAIATWAINSATTGFKDRLERAAVRLCNGKTNIASRFFDSPDGTGTGFSIQDIQTGIIVPSFDTSGDFTVGVRIVPSSLAVAGGTWGGIALGSYSSPNNQWRLESDTNGKMRMAAGAVSSAYTDYTGPALAQNVVSYALLRFFRSTGTLNLRVNGTYEQTLQADSLKTATLAAELAFGLYWDAGGAVTKHRAHQMLKGFAANTALIGADLAAAEAHLAVAVNT